MKTIITVVLLMGLCLKAHAAPPPLASPPQTVKIIVPQYSSSTYITLGSSVGTEITGNATSPSYWTSGTQQNLFYDVTVWNMSTSIVVYCAPSIATPSATNGGVTIAEQATNAQPSSVHFLISPYQQIFCIGASSTPSIVVLKQQ